MKETSSEGAFVLPDFARKFKVEVSTITPKQMEEYKSKTFSFCAITVVLVMVATYTSIAEIKRVTDSLNERMANGQRENYGSKMNLISYCIVCMWQMSYSMIFFIMTLLF